MESPARKPGRVWVPIDWGQTSIVYRTDLAPEYVDNETWAILWDPKYKGKLAVFDSLVDGVVIAAVSDRVLFGKLRG